MRHLWLLLALLAPLVARVAPPQSDLSQAQQSTLGVFVMAAILWATGVVPLAITGLFVLAALPATGAMDAPKALALFGNEAVFFILGAFVLAAAMMSTGLSRRIALFLITRAGSSSRRLALAILLASAALSCVMPEHAVAAILFPTLISISDSLRLEPEKSKLAPLLFLSMAWGCVAGGVSTLLGGARAPLALGILRETTGESISFLEWVTACVPVGLAMVLVTALVLQRFFPPEIDDIEKARVALRDEVLANGPLGQRGQRTAAVLLSALVGWAVFGETVGLATLALLFACALFVVNAVSWREVEDAVNWGVLLMYGGAIALGTALRDTGGAMWLSKTMLGWLPPELFLPAIILLALVLTEVMSNAACVAVLLPVALSGAQQLNQQPRLVVLVVAVAAGLGFTLPVGTPPNAIAFSSGYYRVRQVLLPGLLTSLAAAVVVFLASTFYWPRLSFMMGGN